MERSNWIGLRSRSTAATTGLIGISFILSLAIGCGSAIRRGQSPDDSLLKFNDNRSDTSFIGNFCGIKGVRPAQIEGIGLLVGLEGTGSEPSPSGQKDYLLRELKTNKTTENARAALSSKNTSMVMIRGLIPAGAKRGDRIDLQVTAPPKTDTTSLKYGELLRTDMRPLAALGRGVKLGNVMARAKGIVLVDSLFESSTDEQHNLTGTILGGGVLRNDYPMTLIVNSDETSVKTTRSIAHSINQRYTTSVDGGRENIAKPVTDRIIELRIPEEYEHNLGRFIQSIQAMAFNESDAALAQRMEDLDRRIGDPTSAARAAIELEAIGAQGVPILKNALQHPDFEVRFYIAESLAYMGHGDGISHLQLAAESEPAFRWHALTALASIGNSEAKLALKQMFDRPSAETRYGAFRALNACSPNDRSVQGKLLSDEFYLHDISSEAQGMIHFARSKRPEIVVFGNEKVSEDFIFVQPGLTARAIDKDRVRIKRFDPVNGEIKLTCSTEVAELIKTLARFGLDYTTMLEMCREADSNDTLNARLVINAAPRIGSKSRQDALSDEAEKSDRYIAQKAPELFSDVETGSSTGTQ